MLEAAIPPVPPSAGAASGNGLVLLAVVIGLIVVATVLAIAGARRAKVYGREPEHDVKTYERAA